MVIFYVKWPNLLSERLNCFGLYFMIVRLKQSTYSGIVGRKIYMSRTRRGIVVMCIVLNNVFVSVSYFWTNLDGQGNKNERKKLTQKKIHAIDLLRRYRQTRCHKAVRKCQGTSHDAIFWWIRAGTFFAYSVRFDAKMSRSKQ